MIYADSYCHFAFFADRKKTITQEDLILRYIWQHIHSIIDNYNGAIPLSHFLKNYFRLHPKLGSRDRKIISELIYCYYRCSKAFESDLSLEEKIKVSLFICETSVKQTLQFLPEDWQAKKSLKLQERIDYLGGIGVNFSPDDIISFTAMLSDGIRSQEWLKSMLQQPRLFIRLRKNNTEIRRILTDNGVDFFEVADNCFSLPNTTPVDRFLPAECYVVQDASSQKTGSYFKPKSGEKWWDCCSGAGGKSLLLKDLEPSVQLTVSDKRASILHNLSDRCKLYKHVLPQQFVLDVSDKEELNKKMSGALFDNIICDVPCTGSGTWARTPEQLYFFEETTIRDFSERQKAVSGNVVQYLKRGGRLIYITCSVFEEENEAVVNYLLKNHQLEIEKKELINGVEIKADSMFIAVLRK